MTNEEKVMTALAKIALLFVPRLVGALFYDARQHHLLAGLTVILGVLLQALVPPRRKLLLPLLALAVAFTVVYSVFWK
jgi:hypothetical protein